MSEFYVGQLNERSAKVVLSGMTHCESARSYSRLSPGISYVVTRVDDPKLWSPAHDPETDTTLILGGRLSFTEEEWRRAEEIRYEGGLACRIVLERFLKSGSLDARSLNGAGVVVLIGHAASEVRLWTDRLGVFPVFRSTKNCAVASNADVIANVQASEGRAFTPDLKTFAEVLAIGNSVQPYSYYEEIRMLEPASGYRWAGLELLESPVIETYWCPSVVEEEPDDESIVEALACELKNAVRLRTSPRLGTPLVFLSAGVDSRTAVFGVDDPTRVKCVTMCDEENEELRYAKLLAGNAGAEHHTVFRDPDYYITNAERALRIAGGMWNLTDAHYTGAMDDVNSLHPGTILTGCYADYMMKGLLSNRELLNVAGRALPLYRQRGFDFQYYHRYRELGTDWDAAVRERLETRYPKNLRDGYDIAPSRIEDLRLRPLMREADASGRLFLWRTAPWDHFLSDSGVLDVCGRMSPRQKLNGVLFGKAVGRVIGPRGRAVPNNNYGVPIDADIPRRLAYFMRAVVKRKVRRILPHKKRSGIATSCSWPHWPYVAEHSEALKSIWDGASQNERKFFKDMLEFDPWTRSRKEWAATDTDLFFRILSLLIYGRTRSLF